MSILTQDGSGNGCTCWSTLAPDPMCPIHARPAWYLWPVEMIMIVLWVCVYRPCMMHTSRRHREDRPRYNWTEGGEPNDHHPQD